MLYDIKWYCASCLARIWTICLCSDFQDGAGCLFALGLSGKAIIADPVPLQIRAPGISLHTVATAAATYFDNLCLKDNTFFTQ